MHVIGLGPDRRLVGERQRCGTCCSLAAALRHHPIDPNRAGDVLDLLVTEIFETVRHAIPHLLEYRAGDHHTPGVCERLQPCCDVHAVAVDIVLIDDHIAEVDPDPNFDALVLG